MSNENELKKGNGEVPEVTEEQKEEVEGYSWCTSTKQKCLNDCAFGGPAISHIE